MTEQHAERQNHQELCYPPVGVWLVIAIVAGMTAAALAPINTWVSVTSAAVVFCALGVAVWTSSPKVSVTESIVTAGSVQIPRADIVAAEALSGTAARRALGPDLDARSVLVIRGWLPGVVKLSMSSADEQAPHVLFSTRHPEKVARMLGGAPEHDQHDQSVEGPSGP